MMKKYLNWNNKKLKLIRDSLQQKLKLCSTFRYEEILFRQEKIERSICDNHFW